MKKIILFLKMAIVSSVLFAQTNVASLPLNYQAVVRDANDMLLTNITVGMQISILQESVTGPAVYIETHAPTSNLNGLVTLEIGTGTVVEGEFASIDWSLGSYFLKTEIDVSGGKNYTITGTSPLLSVPFAQYAKTAENILGNTGNLTNITTQPDIFIGESAGSNAVQGKDLIGIGAMSLMSSGQESNEMQGRRNVAIGYRSLAQNTIGSSNIALGYLSLSTGTSAFDNIAIGCYTLTLNTGNNNVAIGTSALYGNSAGSNNIAAGSRALFSNTTGNGNTAIGSSSLYKNTIGGGNTALGFEALYSNTIGVRNTAIGSEALYSNVDGIGNTAIGTIALKSNSNGENNTAVGNICLNANTIGNRNTAIGHAALGSNIKGSDNIAIGDNALQNNKTHDYNVAIGNFALKNNSGGTANVAIGYNALIENGSGDWNVAIGNNAGPVLNEALLSNTTAIGNNAKVALSNTIVLGNSATTRLMMGTTEIATTSDGRFKKNVQANVPGLNFIMKLKPVTFQWDMKKLNDFNGIIDSDFNNDPNIQKSLKEKESKINTGFIAQDVEKAAIECNYNFSAIFKPENEKSIYNLAYSDFVVPIVKAIQEQQAIIEQQQKQIENLQSEISMMKTSAAK